MRFTLSSGTFGSAVPTLKVTAGTGNGAVAAIRSGGAILSTVEFDVTIPGAGLDTTSVFTLSAAGGLLYRFAASSDVGASASITVDTRDVLGALDTTGTLTRTIAVVGAAATLTAAAETKTIVDATATPPRTLFVSAMSSPIDIGDDTTTVAKAKVTLTNTATGVKGRDGVTDYTLRATDLVTITVTGDFTGVSQFAIDLDGSGGITSSSDTATNEVFTINSTLTSATITLKGSRFTNIPVAVFFTKTSGTVLNTPRTFSISATIAPAAGGVTSRTIGSNSTWWTWKSNGTVMTAVYITYAQNNSTKFRFTNSSDSDVLVLPSVVLDQGTFTLVLSSFTIPANGSIQVTLSDTPASGTNEIGPLTVPLSGTQPVRGKAVFTVRSGSANVAGVTLIASPAGSITIVPMVQVVE